MRTFRKDANESFPLGIDWSATLDGESIATSTWTVASGLTGSGAVYSDTTADIVVSGGTEGEQYLCTNQVTTNSGYIFEKSFIVQVVDK